MKKGIEIIRPVIDKVLNDVENNKISSDTIDDLSWLFETMHKYNVGQSNTNRKVVGISEKGLRIHLVDSDIEYHFCPKCKELTRYAITFPSSMI